MNSKFITLKDIPVYTASCRLSTEVWNIVSEWDWFAKKTIGSQWVNSTDSVAANIAEGFGRYHKKDKQKFYYNARGSVYESIHWFEQAITRKLLDDSKMVAPKDTFESLPRQINQLIKITNNNLSA